MGFEFLGLERNPYVQASHTLNFPHVRGWAAFPLCLEFFQESLDSVWLSDRQVAIPSGHRICHEGMGSLEADPAFPSGFSRCLSFLLTGTHPKPQSQLIPS